MTIRRFALLVAAPRDLAINAVVNGLIAWFVFGGRESVPLSGAGSIFVMVLPMVFIESFATTFFGHLAGTLKRKVGELEPPLAPGVPWIGLALASALGCAVVALALAVGVMWVLARWCPGATLAPWGTIVAIASFSGFLAYGLHARAVLRAGRL